MKISIPRAGISWIKTYYLSFLSEHLEPQKYIFYRDTLPNVQFNMRGWASSNIYKIVTNIEVSWYA